MLRRDRRILSRLPVVWKNDLLSSISPSRFHSFINTRCIYNILFQVDIPLITIFIDRSRGALSDLSYCYALLGQSDIISNKLPELADSCHVRSLPNHNYIRYGFKYRITAAFHFQLLQFFLLTNK